MFVMATYIQVKCLMKSQVAQLTEDFGFMLLTLFLQTHTPNPDHTQYLKKYSIIIYNTTSRPALLYDSTIFCSCYHLSSELFKYFFPIGFVVLRDMV